MSSAMRLLERRMEAVDHELNRVFGLEKYGQVRLPRFPWDWSNRTCRSAPIEVGKDGSKKLNLEFDVSQFKPEDVKVVIRDRVLTVRAKREEVMSDGSKTSREYTHDYTLPDEVNEETVNSKLEADGKLTITAQLNYLAEPQEREIPIQHRTSTEAETAGSSQGDKESPKKE
jgi:crystallin alpha B